MHSDFFCQQLDKFTHGITSPTRFVRRNHVNRHLINRLGLEKSLQGHQGCVNCLEWDERGLRLASGSDDCCLIIWDPFEHKHVFAMNTGHVGNIFSVKFMPNLNEYILVTGAADAKIRVHDISRMETRHVFSCHTSRIKRLANTPSEPFIFWSASEDGTVRQFDLRETNQSTGTKSRNVLVNLNNGGWFAEAKCLALNPFRPEMLAVGSNDPYVRVYDRRRLTLHSVSHSSRARRRFPADSGEAPLHENSTTDIPLDAARYFVPGHLPSQELAYRRCFRYVNVTSVSFSPDGDELLANLGGDHIYLFNLNKHRAPFTCSNSSSGSTSPHHRGLLFQASRSDRCLRTDWHHSDSRFTSSADRCVTDPGAPDTPTQCDRCTALEQSSSQAACLVKAKAFVAAVRAYNELIERWPDEPQLYTGRATALLKRGWNGDVYSALLDCQTTLGLTQRQQSESQAPQRSTRVSLSCSVRDARVRDCIRVTALLLSTRCLLRLDWVTEARLMLEQARNECPHLVRQVGECDRVQSPPPNGLSNGLRKPPDGLSVGSGTGPSELGLGRFFFILDCEIRAKELDAEPKCNGNAKQPVEPNSSDAVKSGDAEVFRDPDIFLKSQPSTAAISHEATGESSRPNQHTPPSDPPAISSPTGDFPSISVTVNATIAPSDRPSHDSPDTGPGNSPDEYWLSNSFVAPDSHSAPSARFGRALRSSSPTPLCSCLTCVTTAGKYDNDTEAILRPRSSDYSQRFLGHCNAVTDIKEANFFGSHGQYIVGGSDCGSLFIWDRHTTNTVRILEADSSTVNCVQPHPSICLLASSGIDSVVRLWSPRPEDDADDPRVIKDHVGAAERNQQRSVTDPLEIMLINMGYRIPGLDSGFTRLRRRRRHRRTRHEDRSTGTTRLASRGTQRHERHPPDILSDAEGDIELRIEWDTSLMEHDAEDDDRDSLVDRRVESLADTADADEDYDNPDDLDDMPEVLNATVYTGETVPAVSTDSNGILEQQPHRVAESTEISSRPVRNSNNRRAVRRGRVGQSHSTRSRPSAIGDVSPVAASPIDETKSKSGVHATSSSGFQPPIAYSVFDDDENDNDEEGEDSTYSEGENQTQATVNAPELNSSSNDSTSTRPVASSRGRPTSAPFAALHSVLQNGDHFFVYGTTSTGRRSSPRAEPRSSGTGPVRPADNDEEEEDEEENAVLEIPCSMS